MSKGKKQPKKQMNFNVNSWYIHVLALVAFILVPMLFMMPLMQGKKIYQHDIFQGIYQSNNMVEYRAEKGEEAIWNPNLFSGMPAFQGNLKHKGSIGQAFNKMFSKSIKPPSNILLKSAVCFYILMLVLGVNPLLGIFLSLAFALSTFNIISIEAGHNAKISALATTPLIIASIILAYNRKELLGLALFGIGFAANVASNHFQISYYLFIGLLIYGLLELYKHFKEGSLKRFALVTLGLILVAVVSIGTNTSRMWTTFEYTKESMRGGNTELTLGKKDQTTGLDKEYAMRWSSGIMETGTFIIPNFMGGASQEALDGNSNLAKAGLNKRILEHIPTYWGKQPFVAGPLYQGAIVVFLFVLGILFVRGYLKWWLVSFTILIVLLSWGKNLSWFSDLWFYHVPMYNKFRAPSMIILFLQITLPLLGALGLKELMKKQVKFKQAEKKLLIATGITGGFVLVFGIIGSYLYGFEGLIDDQLIKNKWPIDALRLDRAEMMRSDSFRSLALILASAGILWAFLKGKINKAFFIVGLGLLICADFMLVDKRYLNEKDYKTQRQYDANFEPRPVDLQILQDKDPHYRVMDLTVSTFNQNKPSYFHKSIGGYHGAKIQRYQELIEHHISRNNLKVLDMLNTKYLIVNDRKTNKPQVQRNPNALGNAWFVKTIRKAESADEEILALNNIDVKTEAVVDAGKFKDYVEGLKEADTVGTIVLTQFDNKHMVYKAVNPANEDLFAVFSEIYYNSGANEWKVLLDGNPVDHIRTNYVLRGMKIPSGEHTIEFKFEPEAYFKGQNISRAASGLILLLLLLALFVEGRPLLQKRESKE